MSGNLVRNRFAAVAVKIETTSGTDSIAGSPVAGDFILGDLTVRFNPQQVQDPSFTGSLDTAPGVPGSIRPTLELRVPLRGSGAAATAPSWGALMRACAMEEVLTSSAIVATAAASGSASTATLATPYATTAQLYRGMPMILTGNPTGPLITPCLDYTAGRVATFGETFSPVLSASTLVQLPANALYRPTSDESVYRTVTIYGWRDGFRWRFTGGVGSVRLEVETGGIGMLVFTLTAQYLDQAANANPAAALVSGNAPSPPIFQAGRARLFGDRAQVARMAFDLGVSTALPEDPEQANGAGPGVPMMRASSLDLDPLIDTTNQAALFGRLTSGQSGPAFAVIGSTAGNRFAVTMPAVRCLTNDPGDRNGFGANSIRAQANSPDASLFICQF
jgi:hypothetical protein